MLKHTVPFLVVVKYFESVILVLYLWPDSARQRRGWVCAQLGCVQEGGGGSRAHKQGKTAVYLFSRGNELLDCGWPYLGG